MAQKPPKRKRGGTGENGEPPVQAVTRHTDETETPLEANLARVVDMIIEKFVAKMEADLTHAVVPSVSDVLRLLQFRHEVNGDEPIREITVRWIDPYNPATSS